MNTGKIVDHRDGHEYKIIGIRTQMWFAENLNYADEDEYPSMKGSNWCMDDIDSCSKYGRYYTWSATIDSVYWAKQGKTCGRDEYPCGLPTKVQGICPQEWRVPTEDDWNLLMEGSCVYINGESLNCNDLLAKGFKDWPNATDVYGFTVYPTNLWNGQFNFGREAYFWTTSDNDHVGGLWGFGRDGAGNNGTSKSAGVPVRCILDD